MKSLFWSLLFGALNVRQVVATCYNPDGSAITDVAYQPCNQVSGVFSMCCGTNHTGVVAPDICLPDGLCQNSGDSVYWRQGCTDKTWKSTNCLAVMHNQIRRRRSNNQCSSWAAKAGVVLAATIGASSTSSSSSTATSQSSSSAGTSTSSVTSSTSSTSATNTPTSNAPSGGLDSGAKIGIGVGVTGGVIAIIAVAGAFLILRKRRASDPSVQHGTGQPFIPYHEVEATKTYPVEAPEYVHRAELPNGRRNVELAA
ncbi:uncharacterized protein PAC_09703 [Phialocephala subalpina]|uniref:Mid2 domain-containing protein n=1 Tax=Phialocephala subalpina TaxID=576137 RepID=A0A1L7X451_9HELO|nr:uncharacterized protein PAC_09703 [Phialocephala subalpina]